MNDAISKGGRFYHKTHISFLALLIYVLPVCMLTLDNVICKGFLHLVLCVFAGTFVSAFSVFCCGTTRVAKKSHAFGLNIAAALLQMATFFVIVGWVWSIWWGMTFVQLTSKWPVHFQCPSKYSSFYPLTVPHVLSSKPVSLVTLFSSLC